MRSHLLVDLPLAIGAAATAPFVGWPLPVGVALAASTLIHGSAVINERSSLHMPVTWKLSDPQSVALTFDDGPDPEVTPRVLDVLAETNLKATFFVIGMNAEKYPDIMRRIHDEGHGIGCHSHTHARTYPLWFPQHIRADIRHCLEIISDCVGGALPKVFRPPVGLTSPFIGSAVGALGLETVTWSLSSKDTRAIPVPQMITRLKSTMQGGDIILLHDGSEPAHPVKREASFGLLPAMASLIHDRGWRTHIWDHRKDKV